MNAKKLLTAKQLEICKKEQYYYNQIGVSKNLLQIALEHNFLHRKEKPLHNLDMIKEYEIIIVGEDEKTLQVEVKKLIGAKRLKLLEKKAGKRVEQKTIPVREFDQKFQKLLAIDPDLIEKRIKQFNARDVQDVEVLEIFEMLLHYAIKRQVSDIHINPYEEFCWLRLRVEGRVESKYLLSHDLAKRFSFIIKEKSNLDLVNVQVPQSGSFELHFDGQPIDFRIEIAPANFGENIVIRILNKANSIKSLDKIFPDRHPMTSHICNFINRKNGFFLVVGPTGSGKTTTLNSILTQRQRLHEIIYTIEDPIEYKIDFVTQYQVNESIGFDFPTAMKSVMRQDPDVVVIGEMRDKESIQIALKAAHSGHMVFSTLHTSTAYMAMERIRDEEGDLFILAYSLSGVIAQRLIPKLCSCKVPAKSGSGSEYFKTQSKGYEKKGCIKCNFTGYSGRTLLTDMVFIPPDINVRYRFYLALKNSTVLKAWDDFITFSYFQSAQYLFEHGLSDYETLVSELLALGYIDES